jgi:photosystem II stability/assembly factor-like uncharacterized protein
MCITLTAALVAACGHGGGNDHATASPTATPSTIATPTMTPALRIAWTVGGQLASRSDDGGASWQARFNVAMGGLRGVDFVDRMTGWVVGGRNIYRTSDGGQLGDGRDWENQSANVEASAVELSDVAFVDREHGAAVGGAGIGFGRAAVLTTSDGGGHWRAARVGDDGGPLPRGTWLARMCVTTDGRGATVGGGGRGGTPLALATVDAGVSWTDVTAAITRTAPGEEPMLANCARLASDHLWVVGAPSFLARSSDGGATWRAQTVTSRREVILNAVLFEDSETGWVSGFDPTARQILIFSTHDAGASWDERVMLDNVLILDQPPAAAFAALGPGSVLFVGDDPPSFGLEGARALSFVTHDGGVTWMPSVIPGGFQAFRDVDVVP